MDETPEQPARKPREPYVRNRASADRGAQRIWDALRAATDAPITRAELAELAEISAETAKKLLRRWREEGLIAHGVPESSPTGPRPTYRLLLDLGPIAPILRGGLHPGASGYGDPNAAVRR